MKNVITRTLGVLALLGSAASMAATVTVTPSTGGPVAPGGSFTVLVSVDATMQITSGFTLGLSYDAARVAVVSAVGNPTVAGSPFLTAGIQYTPGSIPGSIPFATTDIVSGLNTGNLVPGPYNAFQITFSVLNSGPNLSSVGAANISLNDDGGSGDFNWQQSGTTYSQASVNVGTAAVPVPAAAWLLMSALGSIAGLKRFRRA